MAKATLASHELGLKENCHWDENKNHDCIINLRCRQKENRTGIEQGVSSGVWTWTNRESSAEKANKRDPSTAQIMKSNGAIKGRRQETYTILAKEKSGLESISGVKEAETIQLLEPKRC